jgi:PAS domain S-box-containing protein
MSHPVPSPRANEPDVEDALLDGVASLVVVLGADGRIVRFNRASEEATGISRCAAVGRTFASVFPGAVDGETSCLDAGGAMRLIEWTRRAVPDVDAERGGGGGGGAVVCTGQDVTDRRAAERAALRESEERFRLAVEASPDTMFFQDAELRLTWVSKVLPPRKAEDFVGRTDAELLAPAEAARLGAIKRRVMETGVAERTEFEHVDGDGRRTIVDVMFVRRADADGKTLGIAGYARDVTDRRAVEHALAELNQSLEQRVAERTESLRFSEERFRLIAEQAPVSIQILSPDGRTLRVNAAFRRLFGVGAEELRDYNILADPQLEAAGMMGQIRRAFAGETVVVPALKYVPDRGPLAGQDRWAQATAYPVLGEDGRVREVVIVHEDVTERRQAEDQLRERERHYREMAERNRLLMQEVEHRVGNNLAGLLGLVTMMRGRVRTVDAFATSIEARLRAMTRVHRSLAGSGWRSIGLGDLVRGVLRGMGQIAQCVAKEAVDGPDVSVPPKLALPLTLILAEWHTNSCKYGAHSVPGGELHVTWTVTEGRAAGTRRIWLTWREQGGPPVRQPVIGSVGSDLVHAFATRELGGGCTMTFPPTGAHHAIEFVVPR